MKTKLLTSLMVLSAMLVGGCAKTDTSSTSSSGSSSDDPVSFTYSDTSYEPTYGTQADNTETHDYSGLKVQKTTADLRSDFAMGVDGSTEAAFLEHSEGS
ncbi:MAG: hypothetical protein WCR56_00690 [Bacilli bacterium]|jgi:hypothetical protein